MEYLLSLSNGKYDMKNAKKYPKIPVKRWPKKLDSNKSLWILCIKKLEIKTKNKGIKRIGENKNFVLGFSFFWKAPLLLNRDIPLNINN